jgi:hypothetical protein
MQEKDMSSREALFMAVDEVSPPKGMDDYNLLRYQEWALRGAEREVLYQQRMKGTR